MINQERKLGAIPATICLLTEGGKADDELSLSGVAKLVRPHGAALLGGSIIGSFCGPVIMFMAAMPAQWEANVTIRIGRIKNVEIESPMEAENRIKFGSLENEVLERRGCFQTNQRIQKGIRLATTSIQKLSIRLVAAACSINGISE